MKHLWGEIPAPTFLLDLSASEDFPSFWLCCSSSKSDDLVSYYQHSLMHTHTHTHTYIYIYIYIYFILDSQQNWTSGTEIFYIYFGLTHAQTLHYQHPSPEMCIYFDSWPFTDTSLSPKFIVHIYSWCFIFYGFWQMYSLLYYHAE